MLEMTTPCVSIRRRAYDELMTHAHPLATGYTTGNLDSRHKYEDVVLFPVNREYNWLLGSDFDSLKELTDAAGTVEFGLRWECTSVEDHTNGLRSH